MSSDPNQPAQPPARRSTEPPDEPAPPTVRIVKVERADAGPYVASQTEASPPVAPHLHRLANIGNITDQAVINYAWLQLNRSNR